MSGEGSVTDWIDRLKAGDRSAAQPLWDRYFSRLVHLARKKLQNQPRRAADEEDIAISAFTRFCEGVDKSLFPKLDDRDDLWQLLVVLTSRKVVDQIRHEHRAKRGSGVVLGEPALHGLAPAAVGAGMDNVVDSEPTPQFAAQVADECRRLLEVLPNDELRQIAIWKMEGYTTREIAQNLGRVVRSVERKLWVIRSVWRGEIVE